MTPAELHAALVARVQERLELARAATPGPWKAREQTTDGQNTVGTVLVGMTVDVEVVTETHNGRWMVVDLVRQNVDAALIAANDPAFTIGMCQAALERLEEHHPFEGGKLSAEDEIWCTTCPRAWPCPEVRREAAVWGVEVDGDG